MQRVAGDAIRIAQEWERPASRTPRAGSRSLVCKPSPARINAASPSDFTSRFDGRTFAGWEQKGNWVIEDGAFFRQAKGGQLTCTAHAVPDDFELRFEWKVSKGCNRGVYYHPGQYEYQALDNAGSPCGQNPRQSAASLFFCMAPSRDAARPVGQWNEGRVVCKGSVIQHWLNGEKVIDFDYDEPLVRSALTPMPLSEAAQKLERERVEGLLKAGKK
jgi:hypothetical protein